MEVTTLDLVKDAYRRLKSHIYYDSTSLHLRKDICMFEANPVAFEKELNKLSTMLDGDEGSEDYWNDLCNRITTTFGVKKFGEAGNIDKAIIHSQFKNKSFEVKREIVFAEIPVQLNIISTLFVQFFGCRIEKDFASTPYGNKLDDCKQGFSKVLKPGLKLYRPYHDEYKRWRNQAIQRVKALDEVGKNSVLISLDIKDFYYSARVNLEELKSQLIDKDSSDLKSSVFDLLYRIHEQYAQTIKAEGLDLGLPLPIGLMSSGLLANWYLDRFDRQLLMTLKPEYYGRYVDDMLVVLPIKNGSTIESKDDFLSDTFCLKKLFEKHGTVQEENIEYKFLEKGLINLTVQSEKLKVIHFVSDELTSLLDKYINESKRDSSEYRLIADREAINADFDAHAFNLEYNQTGQGLTDIKSFSDDKYGISYYLGKKLDLALQDALIDEEVGNRKLLRLFKGPMAIELYRLWEKLFTYLFISKDMKSFHQLMHQILGAIGHLKEKNSSDRYKKFERHYIYHLFMSAGMAYSLKPSLLTDSEKKKLSNIFEDYSGFENFYKFIEGIRSSNMVRHRYIQCPILNYSEADKIGHADLIHNDAYFSKVKSKIKLSEHKKLYSPRFVNFDEVMSFEILQIIRSSGRGTFDNNKDLQGSAFKIYYQLNYLEKKLVSEVDAKKRLFSISNSSSNSKPQVKKIDIADEDKLEKLKVGLVNMAIPTEVVSQEYLRKPVVSAERKAYIHRILNDSLNVSADILVFPEISIPVSSLFWMADYARKNQKAMIFGLEHWVVNKYALNFIVELLPIKIDGYRSLVMNIRLKNHYSPGETDILTGYGYKVPKNKKERYDLIKWKDISFTAFNCFELCNIEHRAFFRSKVDVLFASEFNRDIPYFSNIVESSTRDLHCFIAQSNDSQYGDSRLVQPTKTVARDIVNIKGGIHPTVIVGELNIKALRNFQVLEYNGQISDGKFKPTPPDFEKKNVLDRIGADV